MDLTSYELSAACAALASRLLEMAEDDDDREDFERAFYKLQAAFLASLTPEQRKEWDASCEAEHVDPVTFEPVQ